MNRSALFKRYLDPAIVSLWFDKRVLPMPATVNAVALAAAEDFVSRQIDYDKFSLICTNLHFQAAVRYSPDQAKLIETNVSRLIRAFADPSGNELDGNGHLRSEIQEPLLSALTRRLAS